jgi:uncharacterized protein YciI
MTFAATIEYTPDKARIAEFRPPHRDYLSGLSREGKVLMAGPFADDSGGLIVYEGATEAEVEQLIKADPFYKSGVFLSWVIRPWRIVRVNRDLLPPE